MFEKLKKIMAEEKQYPLRPLQVMQSGGVPESAFRQVLDQNEKLIVTIQDVIDDLRQQNSELHTRILALTNAQALADETQAALAKAQAKWASLQPAPVPTTPLVGEQPGTQIGEPTDN